MLPRKTVCVVFVLILAFFTITPKQALAERNDDYLIAGAGAYVPTSDMLNGGTGIYLSAVYGHWIWNRFTNNLGLEAEFNYLEASGSSSVLATAANPGTGIVEISPVSVDINAKCYSGLFGLKYGRTIGNLELVLGGGAGVYLTKVEATASLLNTLPALQSKGEQDDVSLGAYAKAGFTYVFPSGFLLGAEGKYMWMNAKFAQTLSGDVNVQLQGDIKMDGYTAAVLIGYQW